MVRDACIKHWVFPEQCCTESMSSLGSGYPAGDLIVLSLLLCIFLWREVIVYILVVIVMLT